MDVPFLDLRAQYESIRDEIDDAIHRVVEAGAFASGPFVETFESEFAAYLGVKHAVCVSSGTSALWLALIGLGIGPGDEVLTVPNTFIATAEAVSMTGAEVAFVDVDAESSTMAPGLMEDAITPNTRAIIPVHLYGRTCDMDAILTIAREHDLIVVEDACQAHGARYRGMQAGSMGEAGCFSFYPGKNLGAYGEGGAIVTNNDALAETVRMLRDHGQVKKYFHRLRGWNARMDGIQGAVLSVKLKYLDRWNKSRRDLAQHYNGALRSVPGLVVPKELSACEDVYHLYAARIADRDLVLHALKERGIHCGIHYPVPIHLQEAYRNLGYERGAFPVSERYAEETISLPMYAELTHAQVDRVSAELRAVLGESLYPRRQKVVMPSMAKH